MELNSRSVKLYSVPLRKSFPQNRRMEHWSERMVAAMEDIGLDVPDLHSKTGISVDSLYKYKDGKVDQPRGARLAALAGALGVELLWLREGIEPRHAQGKEEKKSTKGQSTKSLFDRVYFSSQEIIQRMDSELPDWEVERYALLIAQLVTRESLAHKESREYHISEAIKDIEDYRQVRSSSPAG